MWLLYKTSPQDARRGITGLTKRSGRSNRWQRSSPVLSVCAWDLAIVSFNDVGDAILYRKLSTRVKNEDKDKVGKWTTNAWVEEAVAR